MNQIRELDGVLDKEDWDVIANDIPITLLSIELDGEASHVTDNVCTASATKHGGKSEEDRRGTGGIGKDVSAGDILRTLV